MIKLCWKISLEANNLLPRAQPRPQGLLLDDFQNGGSSGQDPGKGWVTWYKVSKNLGDFYHVTFWEAGTKWLLKLSSKLTFRTRKRYLRGSNGFIERQDVIFAGFLEAARLVKEPGVLRYVKFMKIASRNVSCLLLNCFYCCMGDQLISLRIWNKEDIDYCHCSHSAFSCYFNNTQFWLSSSCQRYPNKIWRWS